MQERKTDIETEKFLHFFSSHLQTNFFAICLHTEKKEDGKT